MKIKTCELTDAALDYAVAICECENYYINEFDELVRLLPSDEIYGPSTDWAQGGPIIEREKIHLEGPDTDHPVWSGYLSDENDQGIGYWDGPTPLIAAMRCYVFSKLRDEEVEIPDELLAQ